ncbi:hypothetical protein L325_09600 [Yersinia pestis 9]|nr:hypothetical protein L325_09600 [Yersinia pestis 9]
MLIAKAKSWFRVIYPSPFKIDFGFWVIEGISRGSQKEKTGSGCFRNTLPVTFISTFYISKN